ncbi:MAG: hypothetical protein IJC12_03240 [Peptococcaceae bacterium]|nr:hypothetical protein [Peptococcaceae bacterium]
MDFKTLREKHDAIYPEKNITPNKYRDEKGSLDYKTLRKKNDEIFETRKEAIAGMREVAASKARLANVTRNIDSILLDLQKEFEDKTQLTADDLQFVMFATALQCTRQYCLTNFKPPLNDQEAAKLTKGHIKEHSYRGGQLYHPTYEMIVTSPVPYDAMYGGGKFNLGLSGVNHRVKTLGHDPVLGWVFGTMNILTSTLTNNKFQSYHVRTENKRDFIKSQASMPLIIKYSTNRLLNEGVEGKRCVAAALSKQYVHLCSDMPTKKSLPIPLVTTINEDAALKISEAGINLGTTMTVGSQVAGAELINCVIATAYGFCNSSGINQSLHEVKARKIISYANTLATTSNAIHVAMNTLKGDVTAWRRFDIGGFIATVYRLFNDKEFIRQVEEEFLRKEMYRIIMDC